METTKKEKVINFGLSDQLMDYLNKALESADKQMSEKKEKIGDEIKYAVVEIVKREVAKIDAVLKKDDLDDLEWSTLVNKLDKLSDLIRWY